MKIRVTPSFVVAVLALVLAAGGTGYAAGKITSGQIKDGTIKSRDVKDGELTGTDLKDASVSGTDLADGSVGAADVADGSLTGAEVANGSLPRAKLSRACAADEEAAFGGCVRRVATGPSSHQAAFDDCNQRNGRLPTTGELVWIRAHAQYGWADGNPAQYEFTGDYTAAAPFTPLAFDRGGNSFSDASGQLFWHHCVTTY